MKNYRVHYFYKGDHHSLDFSTDASTEEILRYAAIDQIHKIHREVTDKDISRIEPLNIW